VSESSTNSPPHTGTDAFPTWQDGLLTKLGSLGADVGSRVVMSPPEASDLVPAERFSDPNYLREAMLDTGHSLVGSTEDAVADHAPEVKLAVAASRFTRHYVSSLTASALVALVHGVGIDLSARRCIKVVHRGIPKQHLVGESDEGVIGCEERPSVWPIPSARVSTVDDLRQYVWTRLYAEHLAPLFVTTAEIAGAAPSLLWSNAAEWVAHTADMAYQHLGPVDALPYVEEVDALLGANALPGVEGPNPLRGLIAWVPVDASDFPRGVHTRRHCCITYLLPVRLGRLCGNCPFLPLPERMAMVREARATNNARGGPAERRSIEIGLQKLRPKPRA
jgi:ferric iron reductase protein FhuF